MINLIGIYIINIDNHIYSISNNNQTKLNSIKNNLFKKQTNIYT